MLTVLRLLLLLLLMAERLVKLSILVCSCSSVALLGVEARLSAPETDYFNTQHCQQGTRITGALSGLYRCLEQTLADKSCHRTLACWQQCVGEGGRGLGPAGGGGTPIIRVFQGCRGGKGWGGSTTRPITQHKDRNAITIAML